MPERLRSFSIFRGKLGRAGLCAIATIVVACGPNPGSLAEEAEANLALPDSVLIATGGVSGGDTPDGWAPAISWRRYGTQETWEAVVTYFSSELASRGWSEGGKGSDTKSDAESDVRAWHTVDRIVRIGHSRGAYDTAGSFSTYYEVALVGAGPPK